MILFTSLKDVQQYDAVSSSISQYVIKGGNDNGVPGTLLCLLLKIFS